LLHFDRHITKNDYKVNDSSAQLYISSANNDHVFLSRDHQHPNLFKELGKKHSLVVFCCRAVNRLTKNWAICIAFVSFDEQS